MVSNVGGRPFLDPWWRTAVVDLRMTVDGRPVCAVEHEAIVRLAH